jgi:hypothetical protein
MNTFTLLQDINLKSIFTQSYLQMYSELALNGKDGGAK